MLVIKKTPTYLINLCRETFHSVESFVNMLASEMSPWMNDTLNILLSASAKGVGISVSLQGLQVNHIRSKPIDQLNGLLNKVSSMLPYLERKTEPILFIDKANRLRAILRDADGQATLESSFEWLVIESKTFTFCLPVVTASSTCG